MCSESFNVTFTNGIAEVSLANSYVLSAALAVWGIWDPNFNAMARAVNGKIEITGYVLTTPATGVHWICIAGIIECR